MFVGELGEADATGDEDRVARDTVVPIRPAHGRLAAEAWRLRVGDLGEIPASLQREFNNLCASLGASGRGTGERVDIIFALCNLAEPPHVTPQLLSLMHDHISLVEQLLDECEVDVMTFAALHARYFAACLLARLLTGLSNFSDKQLPSWLTSAGGEDNAIALVTRLAAAAVRALAARKRANYTEALFAKGPHWFAMACPGAINVFDCSVADQVALLDALLASIQHECVRAAIGLALALAWRRDFSKLLAHVRSFATGQLPEQLPELLAALRWTANRGGLEYGPLESCALRDMLTARISFASPVEAVQRAVSARRHLIEGDPHDLRRALAGALDALSPSPACTPAGAAASLARITGRNSTGAEDVAAQRGPAAAAPLLCASPELSVYQFEATRRALAQAHAHSTNRAGASHPLPCNACELIAKLAPSARAALDAGENSEQLCEDWAREVALTFAALFTPTNARGVGRAGNVGAPAAAPPAGFEVPEDAGSDSGASQWSDWG